MAEKEIENLISAAKRKRGANWSSEEEIVLIEEVLKFEGQLFGKMKVAGIKGKHNKIKEETWQSITDTLNLQFRNERTSDTISKKYDNIKQRAKDNIDGIRRPKTGGGPPPAPMTPAEETLYQAMDSRPNIVGLVGGIDTDDISPISHEMEDEPSTSNRTVDSTGDCNSTIKDRQPNRGRKSNKQRNGRREIEGGEIDNLNLENEKMKEEIEKIKLEKRKLEIEIDYIETKKVYLLYKLNAEFPENLLDVHMTSS
ncbi:uncharacterized protein LOC134259115 isoform X1 [Saccostrea cucullata]|uniref:uncharacterized protein LOC134259115 isoform X1 n=1 Tax=Saccostrea cuccullata TaxID=36930 RepID=UPI002ED1A83B